MSEAQGLRAIRTEKLNRYTSSSLAHYMGVSTRTYHKWEMHPETLTLARARKLAEYLDCPIEDIFLLKKEN